MKYGANDLADNIANHTFKILSTATDNLTMKNKHKRKIEIEF